MPYHDLQQDVKTTLETRAFRQNEYPMFGGTSSGFALLGITGKENASIPAPFRCWIQGDTRADLSKGRNTMYYYLK